MGEKNVTVKHTNQINTLKFHTESEVEHQTHQEYDIQHEYPATETRRGLPVEIDPVVRTELSNDSLQLTAVQTITDPPSYSQMQDCKSNKQ